MSTNRMVGGAMAGAGFGPWGAAIGGVAGAAGLLGGEDNAAAEAARLQQQATDRATTENARQYEIGQQNMAPWLQAGRGALTEQNALMGLGGDTAGAMRSLQSSPGYQFRLNQGMQNVNAGLAARGGMGSGKSLAAGQNYAQGFASNEYGNRLSQLGGLSSMGQSSASGMANLGANYANNQGNLWTNNANAQGMAGMAGEQARNNNMMGMASLGIAGYNAMNPVNQSTLGTNSTTTKPKSFWSW